MVTVAFVVADNEKRTAGAFAFAFAVSGWFEKKYWKQKYL